jgi:hypothetical protein
MKRQRAIKLAGSPKALADLLGITASAISQWDEDVPQAREWQLRVMKPDWFVAAAEQEPAWDGKDRRQQPRAVKAA